MPRCCRCHEDKPDEAFAFRSLATGVRQSYCRPCQAAYRREHYLRTRTTYIENERLRIRGHRALNRILILEYLRAHPCVDCGESDPVVLDFDHRDRASKCLEVSRLANAKTWSHVLMEIDKCDVRCASCHRRRTAEQFGWRKAAWESLAADATLPHAPAETARLVRVESGEVRTCCTCGVALPLEEFALKDAASGLRSTKCRSCQRAYSRAHYERNRQKYLDKARLRNDASRDRFAAFLVAYLREHPCVDCGATDPTVLEFDHRDPSEKVETVNALARAQSWNALEAEIAKCDVRCANCHRRRTAKQFAWMSRVGEDDAAA